ncbi:MAG: molybdenum cofactor biosynthesis protein MoaE [Bdellovibrionales bacterium]|nr:molybdenum cofactor biosynthesis protein MoaE [Bdellovibrionales bacterium]
MFEISDKSIEERAYFKEFSNPRVGGVVTFEGRVRNHNEGKAVSSLEYEAYEVLAQKEGLKILEEAKKKFDVVNAFCVHRVGHLYIGDMAVWVMACAEHREMAFKACEYIINEVKDRVPIWKREHYVDGEKIWVRCDQCAKHGHSKAEVTL